MEEQIQEYTTIRISLKLWKKLNDLKLEPKTTPEDVIWTFIKFNGKDNEI